jgi:hypothetical protein
MPCSMEQHALKNVNNCLNTNIYPYLETSGGESSNPYLSVVHFSTPVFIRHLWQLKSAVFLHWRLICVVLFKNIIVFWQYRNGVCGPPILGVIWMGCQNILVK